MSKGRMTAGVRVDAYTESYSDNAYLTLHIVGSEARAFLTPTEARRIAENLKDAADEAEKRPHHITQHPEGGE
jgi:hypothetical protein